MNAFELQIRQLLSSFLITEKRDEFGFLNIAAQNVIFCLITIDKAKFITDFDYFQLRKKENPQSVFVWEDLWISKPEIVEQRLLSLCGNAFSIAARDTRCVSIDNRAAKKFIAANHLHVYTKCQYRFALVYRFQIVAVATFSKGRNVLRENENFRSFELIRYCSSLQTRVVGGMSKLLDAFIEQVHPDDIMTYLDLDWSKEGAYENLGFEKQDYRDPVTFLLNGVERVYDYKRNSSVIESLQTHRFANSGSLKMIKCLKKKI